MKKSPEDAASHFKVDLEEVLAILEGSEKKLLAKREKRVRPHLDDKVITSWNGLMIGAFARGGAILDAPEMITAAQKSAHFIKRNLYDVKTGLLKRRYRDGTAGLQGQLDDYSFLVAGLLDLYQVVHDPELLKWSLALTDSQVKHFWDEKNHAFFNSAQDASLIVRMKGDYDGAEPSANSIAAMNLIRLAELTENEEYRNKAKQLMEFFSDRLNKYPQGLVQMLCAWDQFQKKSQQVIIAGKKDKDDTRKLFETVYKNYNPGRIVLLADGGENQKYLAKMLPFFGSAEVLEGKATAYVCKDFTCLVPTSDVETLAKQLQQEQKE